MIVLWILLGILLAIAVLLCCPVTISLSYQDKKQKPGLEPPAQEKEAEPALQDYPQETTETILARLIAEAEKSLEPPPKPEKEFCVRIWYLLFSFRAFPRKEGKAKKEKQKPEKKPEKKEKETEEKPEKKTQLDDLLELVKLALKLSKRSLHFIRKDLLFHHLELKLVVAKKDSHETAVWYGRMNAFIYGALTQANNFFRIRKTEIQIRPDFSGKLGQEDITGRIKIRFHPIVFLIAGLSFVIPFLIHLMKNKAAEKSKKKKQASNPSTAQS